MFLDPPSKVTLFLNLDSANTLYDRSFSTSVSSV